MIELIAGLVVAGLATVAASRKVVHWLRGKKTDYFAKLQRRKNAKARELGKAYAQAVWDTRFSGTHIDELTGEIFSESIERRKFQTREEEQEYVASFLADMVPNVLKLAKDDAKASLITQAYRGSPSGPPRRFRHSDLERAYTSAYDQEVARRGTLMGSVAQAEIAAVWGDTAFHSGGYTGGISDAMLDFEDGHLPRTSQTPPTGSLRDRIGGRRRIELDELLRPVPRPTQERIMRDFMEHVTSSAVREIFQQDFGLDEDGPQYLSSFDDIEVVYQPVETDPGTLRVYMRKKGEKDYVACGGCSRPLNVEELRLHYAMRSTDAAKQEKPARPERRLRRRRDV